jgi:hypothetical protein
LIFVNANSRTFRIFVDVFSQNNPQNVEIARQNFF